MSSTSKPIEKSDSKKNKTTGFFANENDLITQQNSKQIDKHQNMGYSKNMETGNEKCRKEQSKVAKELKKGKIKELKREEKKYKQKTYEISNDLITQLKKRMEMKKVSKVGAKEHGNIFQTNFPGNEYDCKSESMSRELISHDKNKLNNKNIERRKSVNVETCIEIDFLAIPSLQKNRTFSNQTFNEKKTLSKSGNEKFHRYALYDCKEEYEKHKKPYMSPNNKNNNWQIYDDYGNPWWAKFKVGPVSKLLVPQKNDEDITDDKLVINTQAILQVKEKRLIYSEPQEEDGFNDVYGPIRDLALFNDTQYGKTKIWWISLRNVIHMNLLVSKRKKLLTKESFSKVKKMESFNEKDPITIVRYIKGLPKKQQITQQIYQQVPVRI
uniref:Uncharacterized protein n=1 Tax=Strongyloides papillosus TaxID=174720 RepID=A0A0N5BWS8_STREA